MFRYNLKTSLEYIFFLNTIPIFFSEFFYIRLEQNKKAKELQNWGTSANNQRQKFPAINADYLQDLFCSWMCFNEKIYKV